MIALHDQLIAAVAAIGVMLTSVNLMHDRAADLRLQTSDHVLRTHLAAFADVMEHDIRSMGSGVPIGSPMVVSYQEGRLSFFGTADSSAVARLITYERTPTGTGADGWPRYTLKRFVDGSLSGQSPPLTDSRLALFDVSGTAVSASALTDTRRVRVRMELAPPFEEGQGSPLSVKRAAWESEFAPSNLARRRTEASRHPLLEVHLDLDVFGV